MTETPEVIAPSIRAAVEASLPDLPRLPRDGAAVAALRLYATLLDDTVDRVQDAAEEDQARDFGRMVTAITKIGPRFERMIDMLGMSPGSRPSAPQQGGPAGGDPASAALDQLRAGVAAVAARFDPAATVDPAVTAADAGD
ncbi:hypothetical protein [Actinoplanes sp. NPDC049802]|uniref:hypothetical protein n=1 Tax=Actinoplanes sp. NPDC049802 TaxID=3154742 RepID=UPI00340764A8